MKTIPVPGFCGPTNTAISTVIDSQRTINLYPEVEQKDAKTPNALVGRPGLGPTLITLGSSPVRQLWSGDNRLFAVSGTHAYEIGSAGVVITDFGAMAASTGVGPAKMIANGTQLLVFDRSAGAPSGQIFSMDAGPPGVAGTTARRAAIAMEYLDGFYVALDVGNLMYVSNFLDGTVWPALNVVQLTGGADAKGQLAVLNSQLWVFGQKTTEVWYNAGNPLFPFARVPGATLNLGCLAFDTVVTFQDSIIWLGTDTNGIAHVYQTQGIGAKIVSNPAIENAIGGITTANPSGNAGNMAYSHAYSYTENGHTFYVLQLSNSSFTPQSSYVYDLITGMWHERTYAAAWPVCYTNVGGVAFNVTGPGLIGDGFSGKVMYQGQGYTSDAGTSIVYTRIFPHIADRNHFIKYPSLELDCDIGTAQPVLSYSNDGGKTYPYTLAALAGSGETSNGSFPRFIWRQLGRSRDRVFKLVITNAANLIRLVNAYIGVSPGTEA